MSEQVNYLALFLAVIASMTIGALWYSLLAKPWMRAAGIEQARLSAGHTIYVYALTAFCHALMAYVFIGVIYHAGPVTVINGVMSALFIWGGFVMTSMIVNHRFQRRSWSLTAIDSGHYLAIMLAQGAILGWFGVKS
ncbi:DUF1761 domain-containing protein [Pseudahrensia aquimaris]|uniref:DUF1761 domain-containing protein n=1 Tax=Pseudahrensia aquimaris TaxID=744461 RepID=A0ABW3FKM6_9HYPH